MLNGDGLLFAFFVGKQLHRGQFIHRDSLLYFPVALGFSPELLCQVVAVKAPLISVLVFALFGHELSDLLNEREVPDSELCVSLWRIS